jgi:hypothetical protein
MFGSPVHIIDKAVDARSAWRVTGQDARELWLGMDHWLRLREALGLGNEHWRSKAIPGSNYAGQEAYIFPIDAAKRRLRTIV